MLRMRGYHCHQTKAHAVPTRICFSNRHMHHANDPAVLKQNPCVVWAIIGIGVALSGAGCSGKDSGPGGGLSPAYMAPNPYEDAGLDAPITPGPVDASGSDTRVDGGAEDSGADDAGSP